MDVLPRISRQLFDVIEKMTVPQRILFSISTLLVLAGFGWVVVQNQQDDFRPLAAGKPFSTNELFAAEQALSSANLTGFRRDGQQLLAPANELEKYNSVVAQANDSTPDLGTQMLRQYESLGPFSTDRQRQQMKEALLLQELRLMIKKVPEIEDARVAVASSDRRGSWNQRPRSTANVTLKPKPGKEISAGLVSSLRHVVANMVPDLSPADVTIFDVTKGAVYSTAVLPVIAEETDSDRKTKELAGRYEQQLRKSLAHIRNANVTVHLETRPTPRARPDRDSDDAWSDVPHEPADELIAQADEYETGFRGSEEMRDQSDRQPSSRSNSIKVAVTFPRDYVNQIAKRRASKGETSPERLSAELIEDEVVAQVERIISRMLPGISSENAISVTCVDPVSHESESETTDPRFAQIENLLQVWKWHLMGAVFLLFSLMSLFAVRRTVKPPETFGETTEDVHSIPITTILEPTTAHAPVVAPPDRIVQLREDVRTLVSSDTSASTAILVRWLSEGAA